MKSNPYLVFNGSCEKAILLYQKAFGGETKIIKFKDMPANPNFPIPEEQMEKVLHGLLKIGDTQLLFSDNTKEEDPVVIGNNVTLTMEFENGLEFDKAYDALKEDAIYAGTPVATFFSEKYAQLTDCYGTSWQLTVNPK